MYYAELGKNILLINVYGPYLDKILYWDRLLRCSFMDCEHLVLGGDLNFTLGLLEVWGTRSIPNPLSNYFLDALD